MDFNNIIFEIKSQYDENIKKNANIKKIYDKVGLNKATYREASEFASLSGRIVADAINEHLIKVAINDKVPFEVVDLILPQSLKHNHEYVSDICEAAQKKINSDFGVGIKPFRPYFDDYRVEGLVTEIAGKEKFSEFTATFKQQIENVSLAAVDRATKVNADFHYKSGLSPVIKRIPVGHCCKWCQAVAGTYKYESVKNTGNNVFRRHTNCRCMVIFENDKGFKQDVWSKKSTNSKREDIIENYKIRTINAGAKNYIRDESYDFAKSAEQIRREKHAYLQYDAIKNRNQDLEKRKIFNNISEFESMKDFTKEDVDIAFNHVFNDMHELSKGRALFEPDFDMAQSWTRLSDGKNIKDHDLVLLRHERLEHDYMYKENLSYDDAHNKTNLMYNYVKALHKHNGEKDVNF